MRRFSRFMKRHFSFRWFANAWTVKQKWAYVALYVILYRVGLIPILVIAETVGLFPEGSFLSLGVLLALLVLWFGVYQVLFNFFVARDGD